MKSPSLHTLTFTLAFIAAVCCMPSPVSAACSLPASGSLVICQPSANSTVFQVPHIEAAANPKSGSITDMKVFIDNRLVFQTGGPDISLFEGGVANGTHRLMVKASDDLGRLYEATETFSITGNLPASCPPASVGVRICAPTQGQVVSQNLEFAAGFKGNAAISHVRAYVDNKAAADFSPPFSSPTQLIASAGPTTAGSHTLTIVAWDTNGVAYKSSVGLKTFYEGSCPPKGNTCNPGIYPNTPNDGDDVKSPFRLSASVEFNTAAITAMKVYVNGALAGSSSGPVIDQPIPAAKGTHIVVIQAWDTAGKLYRLTENVNVE